MKIPRIFLFSLLFLSSALGTSAAEPLKMSWKTLDDRAAGTWAVKMLVPEGWRLEGEIQWSGLPGKTPFMRYTVAKNDGTASRNFSYGTLYTYTTDQMAAAFYGSKPPMKAVEYLKNVTIPGLGLTNPAIVAEKKLPSIAEEMKKSTIEITRTSPCYAELLYGASFDFDAASIDITYTKNGRKYFERITTLIIYTASQMLPMMNWGPASIIRDTCTLRTKGENLRIFDTINSSTIENPVWTNKTCQVNLAMVKNQKQQLASIGEASRYLSRTSNEIDDMLANSYKRRNETMDRIFTGISEANRGVNSYHDPINDNNIEIPTTYDHVYTDGNTLLMSENPVDPNPVFTQPWQELKRRE